MEFVPNNRVLSGELIVFQNEMLEIFKAMVRSSTFPLLAGGGFTQVLENPLSSRFVSAVILEFLRTLLENQIPQ
jgi:hypothetical protein